ncbi:hypothetical protein NMY22_g12496 [Coprinellus aureogranulatus]|nr:hypothetical protein NMY22_g12496 [Coprinellus aureogranulatus]
MPHYAEDDDLFTTNGSYLSTSRGSSSRQTVLPRKSSASLRGGPGGSSLANEFGGGNDDGSGAAGSVNGRHHSLAHELAVALMPEPSAGSKLLAEEFGIEFDEGAEGIDEDTSLHAGHTSDHTQLDSAPDGGPSFADELGAHDSFDSSFAGSEDLATTLGGGGVTDEVDESLSSADLDPVFDSPSASRIKPRQRTPEKDAMDILSENLEFTDKFLTQLRILDSEPGTSGSSSQQQHQPKLEKLASDVIRKINESVKDREGQVRALFDCEREFRKISGEVGGGDVLGQLDELEEIEDLNDDPSPTRTNTAPSPPQQPYQPRSLKTLVEEDQSHDWEVDPDRGHHLGDYEESEPPLTPIRTSFPTVPPLSGPPTPAKIVPQLTYVRTLTSATISSLTSISEHSQVNGVATADAGRKIRSLKNKLGSWKTEWESAERSRARIERWEAGIVEPADGSEPSSVPPTPTKMQTMRRVDGRKIVAEQLQAFERALADAAIKTQAIMAR